MDYTVESGYNAVLDLEKEGIEYSAVLAANDMMALGALRALKEFSYKIPETKEIIGFDNINFSQYCEPPLSTIQQGGSPQASRRHRPDLPPYRRGPGRMTGTAVFHQAPAGHPFESQR